MTEAVIIYLLDWFLYNNGLRHERVSDYYFIRLLDHWNNYNCFDGLIYKIFTTQRKTILQKDMMGVALNLTCRHMIYKHMLRFVKLQAS